MVEEYRSIETGAGWFDRSAFGRLQFEGADVLSFLQALLTNDVTGLQPGDARYAAYLTPQGRMLADLEIHMRPGRVVAEVSPGTATALAARFDQLIFSEDVRVSDISGETAALAVVGAHAVQAVSAATGLDAALLRGLTEPGHVEWPGGFVAASGEARLPMFKIFADAVSIAPITSKLEGVGVQLLSPEIVEALRIDAGRARFGLDLGADTIPLEAGLLERGISTSKGCYVGQEIVIRMLHRGGGRVAKHYVTLTMSPPEAPPRGAALVVDGREVGKLTSVAPALTGDGFIGIGHLARDFAEVGRLVFVRGTADAEAHVTGFTS